MDYETYREGWDSASTTQKVNRVPINMDLEVTTWCNLFCTMCEHSFNPPKHMNLDFDLAKKIIDEFASKGGLAIKFCYLGEPLLYPRLAELVGYAKKKGVLDTIVATNGMLLNQGLSKKLLEMGLDLIILSIDSRNPQIYEKIRVNGRLPVVIANLAIFKYLRDQFGYKTRIQIQAIPMDLNREELESGKYQEFFKDFSDVVRISPYCEDYQIEEIIPKTPLFNCPSVWRRMTVRANGIGAVCCGRREKSKILGDLRVQSLEDLWTGVKFREIRKLMREGKSHLIECCKKCSFRVRK